MQVSYMGTTYYVCCSGCRDAFNENPAKVIAEYQKKKKGAK
jgi:YHS domain-containing protein